MIRFKELPTAVQRRVLAALDEEKPKDVVAPPRRGRLNKTERAYELLLRERVRMGELAWVGPHESVALTIATGDKRAQYRPDFPVLTPAGRFELHECKGWWREAARLRIKVAAGMYPFRFVGVRLVKGEWVFEEFGP